MAVLYLLQCKHMLQNHRTAALKTQLYTHTILLKNIVASPVDLAVTYFNKT